MFGPDEHLSLPFGNQTVEWTITITHLCMILPFNCQSIGDFPFCLISGGYPHIEMTELLNWMDWMASTVKYGCPKMFRRTVRTKGSWNNTCTPFVSFCPRSN